MTGTVRQEVFTRRGGIVVWNLPFAGYPANYSAPVFPLRRLQRGMVRQP